MAPKFLNNEMLVDINAKNISLGMTALLINSSSFVSKHHILFSTVSNMIITVESMLRLSDRYN